MISDRRQIAWGLVDQGLSSATNFGGSVLAARLLSAHEFGAFAVGFSLYLVVLGLSRAWSSDPLLVRFATAAVIDQNRAIRRGAMVALGVGALGGLVLVAAASVFWSSVGGVLVVVAVFLPALTLQDFCRYALIVRRRSRDAALNDLLWLVVLLVVFALLRSRHPSAAGAVVCWAAGATLAAIVGLVQLRCRPSRRIAEWIRAHRDLSWRYSGEFILLSGSAIFLTVGLGAVSGLSDVAGFRGAQVALGPLGVLFTGATMQMTPIMARAAQAGGAVLRRIGERVSVALASVAAVWGLVLVLVPDHLGVSLLGSSWTETRPLLPIWALYYLASGILFGATIGLRACGAARTSLRLRAIVAPVGLGMGVLGAAVDGPAGASLGLLIGNLVALPLWWRAFVTVCETSGRRTQMSITPSVERGAHTL